MEHTELFGMNPWCGGTSVFSVICYSEMMSSFCGDDVISLWCHSVICHQFWMLLCPHEVSVSFWCCDDIITVWWNTWLNLSPWLTVLCFSEVADCVKTVILQVAKAVWQSVPRKVRLHHSQWLVCLRVHALSVDNVQKNKMQTHERFKRTLIYCDTDIQSANFWG